jgi:hypothetical protein
VRESYDPREPRGPHAKLREGGIRKGSAGAIRCHALQRIQPIGLGKWKPPEEDIDDAEDGRVRGRCQERGRPA